MTKSSSTKKSKAKKGSSSSLALTTPNLSDPAVFYRRAALAAAYHRRPLNLKEIRLPPGDVGSINIGWSHNGAAINLDPDSWLSQGFDGVRLVPATPGQYIRCTAWDGLTLAVRRHPGVVQLEDVTLVGGSRAAMQFGEQNFSGVTPRQFAFRFLRSRAFVPPPEELGGARGKWLLFGYNYDELLEDVELDATLALEHARYRHGSAWRGDLWLRVNVLGAAAECKKDRMMAYETAWHGREAFSITKSCVMQNWGQPWSNWQGGGGIVQQNANTHWLVEDTLLKGRDGHNQCVMVSADGGGYDMESGSTDGRGYGNGFGAIRRSGLIGEMRAGFWRNEVHSVYRLGGPARAAMGSLVEESGVYGFQTALRIASVPPQRALVRNCNRLQEKAIAERLGIDTTYETVIPTANRLVPVSEGYFA